MGLSLTVLEQRTAGVAACSMLEFQGQRLLLDCGYDDSAVERHPSFPVRPDTINAVVLTHGHLGHCGLLPVLVRNGFKGKVYCSTKAQDIAIAGMQETALMQEEDSRYWTKKAAKHAPEPVYSEAEVLRCKSRFETCRLHSPIPAGKDLTLRFFRAGHGTGSAFVQISIGKGPQTKRILHVGDVGCEANDLYLKSVVDVAYDCVCLPAFRDISERPGDIRDELARVINSTCESGGNILIPVFSMDRRNSALKMLQELSAADRIPSLFVFVDSPTAGIHSKPLLQNLRRLKQTLALKLIETVEESKSLNMLQGTAVIIAGSGKGDQGRMQFYLKRHLARPESAVILLGDSTRGTLWGQLERGDRKVTILGEEIEAKAQVHKLVDRMMHLPAADVVKWLGQLNPAPKCVAITHGEEKAKGEFLNSVKTHLSCDVKIPTETLPLG